MAEWLSIPRLVDLILLGMALEALWLFGRHRKNDLPGVPPMLLHLISGTLLLLAMKLALTETSTVIVAATLGLAGAAHCADLLIEISNST